ncbi:MAG: S-layer homology domain-containing protein [Bacillota bacterium]
MKKLIAILTCLLMVGSIFTVSNTKAKYSFYDVNEYTPFYQEIMYLSDKLIVRGEGSAFHPQEGVTRAAAATMIGRALLLDGEKRESSFSDVSEHSYAVGYIESAVELGIIKGYTDHTFRPNDIVTRGEMAIFIARAFNLEEEMNLEEDYYDIYPSMASYQAIIKVSEAGIAQGLSSGFYLPYQDITRAQFSAFLARALDPGFRVELTKFNEPLKIDYKEDGYRLKGVQYPNGSTIWVEPGTAILFTNVTNESHSYAVTYNGNAVAEYAPINNILLTNGPGESIIQLGGGLSSLTYFLKVK